MLLCFDVGNSRVSAALFDGGTIVARASCPTLRPDAAALLAALGGPPPHVPLLVAGVVPAAVAALVEAAGERGRAARALTAADLSALLPVRYDPPHAAGLDRLLNALAARELHGAPVLVADLGTATNIDVVATDGAFVGGAILCGLATGRDALAAGTALLPAATLLAPAQAIGGSTAGCLQSGLVLGHALAIQGLVARMRAELAAPAAPLVGTGGLAELAAAALPSLFSACDPDLTLHGMRLTWSSMALGGD